MRLKLPRSIKRVTNPVFGRIPLRIIRGVNKGSWWSVAAAGSGYGSGTRETKQMHIVTSLIRPGDVVWDLGAHFGYITLAAARRTGTSGQVCAFEPSKSNRWFLQRHVKWNRLRNTKVYDLAVGSMDGTTSFGGASSSQLHKLGGGDDRVEVRTISTLLREGLPAPDFLKIDVEGAEADVLRAGLQSLRSNTRLLIEVHNKAAYAECVQMLRAAGYTVAESQRVRRFKVGKWGGGADIAAFGPMWRDTSHDMQMLQESEF